ncbi:MAG: hypothetical protein R6V72_11240 [Cyclobacterium sp.]|uniref:hypothetical protein n=1 Tax=unclassified Cyclobacterium TaxID=2615055 RepID=UPI0013D4A7AF|nr:hypothetical protein [Cyclobacterium sp. SYSU L10401]
MQTAISDLTAIEEGDEWKILSWHPSEKMFFGMKDLFQTYIIKKLRLPKSQKSLSTGRSYFRTYSATGQLVAVCEVHLHTVGRNSGDYCREVLER